MVSVLGQTVPASGALVKRDYYYLNDQHLTARFGNSMVCGDHMCAPGEWSKMQENLNKAQIGHGVEKNVINATTTSTTKTNSTSTTSTPPVQPIPMPIPTPPPVPYSVCNTVKTVLTNSTISSSVVAKIMTSLGCS